MTEQIQKVDIEKAIELLEPGVNMPKQPHTWQDVDKACEVAVAVMRSQLKRRWIPVSERLPDEGQTILFYHDTHGIKEGKFRDKRFWAYGAMGENWYMCTTHWMPLPEPPKEG